MKYVIDNVDVKKRLDVFLSEKEKEYTRSYIKILIDSGKVTVNGEIKKSGYSLKSGDEVNMDYVETRTVDAQSEDIPVNIIYEDDDILIIDKPKGMVVHPGHGNYTGTLVNALLYSHAGKLSGINGVIRPGIVHRIDKDTTGILVVAKNDNAHKSLSDMFKVHSIKREYIALVKGIIKEDNMTINLPIGRSQNDRKKMTVTTKNSRSAITHVKVLERFYNSNVTLIQATLETGRTHQIRVHLKYVGHPLLGDETYSKKDEKIKVKGHLLHAKTLGFMHPTLNKYVEFNSDVPKEFSDVLNKLRNKEK